MRERAVVADGLVVLVYALVAAVAVVEALTVRVAGNEGAVADALFVDDRRPEALAELVPSPHATSTSAAGPKIASHHATHSWQS